MIPVGFWINSQRSRSLCPKMWKLSLYMITRVPFYPQSSNFIGRLVKDRRWSLMLLGSVAQTIVFTVLFLVWHLLNSGKMCKYREHLLYNFMLSATFVFFKHRFLLSNDFSSETTRSDLMKISCVPSTKLY